MAVRLAMCDGMHCALRAGVRVGMRHGMVMHEHGKP